MPEAFHKDHTESTLTCPRDRTTMAQKIVGEAVIDVCPKCQATYFDVGELFAALGSSADPSFWDRPESAGAVRDSGFGCPRCKAAMLAQDITYGEHKVEIDRCSQCGGVFLDGGEGERLKALGAAAMDTVLEESRRAKVELEKMEDPDFSTGFFDKFLGLFAIFGKKKKPAE